MESTPSLNEPTASGEVINFDDALLDACAPAELAELMTEATLLAAAFAPEGRAKEVAALARSLQSGVRDLEFGRAHARLLAAALGRLARRSS